MTITLDDIRKDLGAFALKGELPFASNTQNGDVKLAWTARNEQARSAVFRLRDEWIVEVDGGIYSYLDFLASSFVADLAVLAQRTMDSLEPTPDYIDVEVEIEDEENKSPNHRGAGVETLIKQMDQRSTGPTQVLFLRGAAGAGKSAMLREVARRLAQQWIDGSRRGPLALYVDAQGKALLSLDDTFSSVLADLDVLSIRKEAVATLCRHALLVPCVDGFDELLGSGGFGDAFNSLSGFLSRLKGAGTVLASGRSTFYDQEQLQITATRYRETDYRTTTITVHPWSKEAIQAFCSRRWRERDSLEKDELLNSLQRSLRSETFARLAGKPFFAAQIARMMPGSGFSDSKPLISQLLQELLVREARKWVSRTGEEVLSPNQHEQLLKEIALEMWWANSLEINTDTARIISDLIAQGVPLDHKNVIISKAPHHGAFEPGSAGRSTIRFQHSIYFDYFLSLQLFHLVEKRDAQQILAFLERGILGNAAVEILSQLTDSWDPTTVSSFINMISSCLKGDGRFHVARLNAGAIASALLDEREQSPQDCLFRYTDFQRVKITRTELVRAKFEFCNFEDVSIHGLVLRDCEFSNCSMRRVRIGRDTRFASDILAGCDVISLINDDEGEGITAAREKVVETLRQHGARTNPLPARSLTKSQQDKRTTLERLLRKLDRQFFFGEDFERIWGLSTLDQWPSLRDAMLRCGVLERRVVQKGGANATLLASRFTSASIRDGEARSPLTPQPILDLWSFMDK